MKGYSVIVVTAIVYATFTLNVHLGKEQRRRRRIIQFTARILVRAQALRVVRRWLLLVVTRTVQRYNHTRGETTGERLVRRAKKQQDRAGNEFRPYKGRNERKYGEGSARYKKKSGYVPPYELKQRYAISSKGVKELEHTILGEDLSVQEMEKLEAFHGKGLYEVAKAETLPAISDENKIANMGPRSASKARKKLLFLSEDIFPEGVKAPESEHSICGEEISAGDEIMEDGEVKLEGSIIKKVQEKGGFGEVHGLMEESHELIPLISTLDIGIPNNSRNNVDEVMQELIMDEDKQLAMGEINQGAKKKLTKTGLMVYGGRSKKMIVQGIISPRKKTMVKLPTRTGEESKTAGSKASSNPRTSSAQSKIN